MTKTKKVKFNGPKQDLVELLNGLYACGELTGKTFAIMSSKNITKIKALLEDVEELAKPSEGFIALAEKVKEVQKDDDAQTKIDALEKTEPELVEARKAQIAAVTSMLSETVEIELEGITTSDLPEEIKAHQLSLLTKILID